MKKIEVYADWQPGYMGETAPTEREYFDTLEGAEPTIKQWRKTACTIIVSEVEVIKKYVWGKKKMERKLRQVNHEPVPM